MKRSYFAFFTASLLYIVSTSLAAPNAGGQTIDTALEEKTRVREDGMRGRPSVARGRGPTDVAIARGRVFAEGDLKKPLGRLLAGSELFRAQYARVVKAGVIVGISHRVPVQYYFRLRAVTMMVRQRGRLQVAMVRIKPGHDPVELIAHEFEHIAEQLDGVRYKDDLSSARGGTRRTVGEAVETNRAKAAGRLAARQVRESERNRKKADRLARAS